MNKCLKKMLVMFLALLVVMCMLACNKNANKSGSVEAKKILPLYNEVDLNNLPDGIYNVSVEGIRCSDDGKYLQLKIFSEDLYDMVDIHNIKVGDVFVYGRQEEKVEKVAWDENKSKVAINVDSFEDNIWYLSPSDSGGTYYFVGLDDHHSYTERGISKLKIGNNCVLKDESQVILGGEAVNLGYDELDIYLVYNSDFIYLNTNVRVENGEIVEINKWFIP